MLAAAACLALTAPAAAQEPDLQAAGLDAAAAQPAPADPGYAGPPPSDGPPVAGPVLPPPDAAEVLADAEDALTGDDPGAHITLALQELSELLPALSGPQRLAGDRQGGLGHRSGGTHNPLDGPSRQRIATEHPADTPVFRR